MTKPQSRPRPALDIATRGVAAILLLLACAGPGEAAEWSVEVEPLFLDFSGHDPHVLTVHRMSDDGGQELDRKTGVLLETDSGPGYRVRFLSGGERWGWGVDFLWFSSTQETADRTASATGGEVVSFEIADRTFFSAGPGQELFYRRLEDTDVALWTADVYAARTLAEGDRGELRLLLGLRNGDFDNDYRAAAGVAGVGGTRIDASSNYDRMLGPLVGLRGGFRVGESTFEASLAQSVILGSVELRSRYRDFAGPFGETPAFFADESFRTEQDVAIPITELDIRWRHEVSRRLAVGLGAHTAIWADVPTPPGVAPLENGTDTLHENTIVLTGLSGAVRVSF